LGLPVLLFPTFSLPISCTHDAYSSTMHTVPLLKISQTTRTPKKGNSSPSAPELDPISSLSLITNLLSK
ncbi:hypothetical protein BAE44_0018693, partial [Dichanthelium oligosanthes]